MIQDIQQHRVQNGNLMDGVAPLMQGDAADLIYSDPPWGGGNLKYWETKRLKDTGAAVRRDNPLEPFLIKFFDIAQAYAKNVVIVEYGKQWADTVKAIAAQRMLGHLCTATTLYKSGSKLLPMDLHLFAKRPSAVAIDLKAYVASVEGTHGWATVVAASTPFASPGGIVLDPCCGLGYSARMAVHHGMRFRGNELNAKRLEKTVAILEKSCISRP